MTVGDARERGAGSQGAPDNPVFTIERWTDPALPPSLQPLMHEAMQAGYAWMTALSSEWAGRPFTAEGEALYIARDGGGPVGMAVISEDPYVAGTAVGRLRFIFITGRARRSGLARQLVERCLLRAGTHWRRLRLHTDNPVAARLYADYGFHPVDEPRTTHATENWRKR